MLSRARPRRLAVTLTAITLLAALAAIAPVSVSASTPIEAKEGKPWKHKATGTSFPATLAGFSRTSLVYFTAPEVDVAANYASADGGEAVTLYRSRLSRAGARYEPLERVAVG